MTLADLFSEWSLAAHVGQGTSVTVVRFEDGSLLFVEDGLRRERWVVGSNQSLAETFNNWTCRHLIVTGEAHFFFEDGSQLAVHIQKIDPEPAQSVPGF